MFGENINEVIKDKKILVFGLEAIKKILEENKKIDIDSLKILLENINEKFGEEGWNVLPKVKIGNEGGELNRDEYINKIIGIAESFSYVPIMVELKNIILEQRKGTSEEKETMVKVTIRSEGKFDVDWEAQYNKTKKELDEVKSELSAMKKKYLYNERVLSQSEKDQIFGLVNAKDLEGLESKLKEDPALIYAMDVRNNSLLYVCCENGWTEGVDLILDISSFDVDYINRADRERKTSLMMASDNGHLQIVKSLVAKGANIEAQDIEGKTALMYGCEKGQVEASKYLIEKGANVNAKDKHDKTPLMFASLKGSLEIVKFLVENGADIEALDIVRRTPLMHACLLARLEVVKYLVEKNASVNITDSCGNSAKDYARKRGVEEVIDFLKYR